MKASKQRTLFEDYEGFVDKFKPKKTTDDCYTPPEIYDEVLRYVGEITDLTNRPIVRPFYPGGDYENYDYPDRCIVVDNPPFSIYTKIVRFYLAQHIDFFLFAPHLTQFVTGADCCYIVCGAQVIYENGANIPTSFTTSLLAGTRVLVNGDLYQRLENIQVQNHPKTSLSKYDYPDNITTTALLGRIAKRGLNFTIPSCECICITKLDNSPNGNNIFGGGLLLSERMAAEKTTIENMIASQPIKIEFSEREKAIVASLPLL